MAIRSRWIVERISPHPGATRWAVYEIREDDAVYGWVADFPTRTLAVAVATHLNTAFSRGVSCGARAVTHAASEKA